MPDLNFQKDEQKTSTRYVGEFTAAKPRPFIAPRPGSDHQLRHVLLEQPKAPTVATSAETQVKTPLKTDYNLRILTGIEKHEITVHENGGHYHGTNPTSLSNAGIIDTHIKCQNLHNAGLLNKQRRKNGQHAANYYTLTTAGRNALQQSRETT